MDAPLAFQRDTYAFLQLRARKTSAQRLDDETLFASGKSWGDKGTNSGVPNARRGHAKIGCCMYVYTCMFQLTCKNRDVKSLWSNGSGRTARRKAEGARPSACRLELLS